MTWLTNRRSREFASWRWRIPLRRTRQSRRWMAPIWTGGRWTSRRREDRNVGAASCTNPRRGGRQRRDPSGRLGCGRAPLNRLSVYQPRKRTSGRGLSANPRADYEPRKADKPAPVTTNCPQVYYSPAPCAPGATLGSSGAAIGGHPARRKSSEGVRSSRASLCLTRRRSQYPPPIEKGFVQLPEMEYRAHKPDKNVATARWHQAAAFLQIQGSKPAERLRANIPNFANLRVAQQFQW